MSGRFYRNRRRFYRRRYGRRGYGSRASRRAYGNMKAARQQADNATFTINVPTKISTFMKSAVQLPGLPAGQLRTVGVYPISIHDLLRRNEFFNNYSSMYDEFKIDKIKVKLLPTSFTINTNGNYRNLTVYTAWDRTGLNTTQLHGYVDKARPENNKIYCTIGEDITTYSSAESRTVNPNTNTSITRWLNPKTMNERSQWLSTSLLKKWYETYDEENGCFTGINFDDSDDSNLANIQTTTFESNALIKWSNAARDNPCFLLEDPAIKFKPTLLVGVFPAVTSADFASNTNRIHFNVETEIVCTYRGLRKARVLSTTSESGQQLIVGPKPTEIQANGIYYANRDGLNGYSSVTVNVPQQGGGDDQIPENQLAFVLTDDVISTAQNRTDTAINGGQSLRGFVDWPQMGTVQWVNVTGTSPDANAKWVDAALVDVSRVNLAETWQQNSPLNLNNVITSINDGFTLDTAVYPENYSFTTNSVIYFNNNQANGPLVNLQNNTVNCIPQEINVKDISSIPNTSIQDQVNANPLLEPDTHGAYVETINENGVNKQVVHFTFELPSGQNYKTVSSGGMDIDPIPVPRLYGRKFQGYFNLPSIQKNITITEPGVYAIGNFDGDQNVLEIEKQTNNQSNQINTKVLPNELDIVKKDSVRGINDDFSFGTFTVSIPSGGSIPTSNKYHVTLTATIDETDTELLDMPINLSDESKYILYGDTFSDRFDGTTQNSEDIGKWACVYWNNFTSGAFVFEIEDGDGPCDVRFSNNSSTGGKLNRFYVKVGGDVSDDESKIVLNGATLRGFGYIENDTNKINIPLCLDTGLITKSFDENDNINIEISDSGKIDGVYYANGFRNVIQAAYDNSRFTITESTIPFNQQSSQTSKKANTITVGKHTIKKYIK